MSLLEFLGVTSADDIDPDRSIQIGRFTLGIEAAAEAVRILNAGQYTAQLTIHPKNTDANYYWSVSRRGSPVGEIFGFGSQVSTFPTALELAIVRTLGCIGAGDREHFLEGNHIIALGDATELQEILKLILMAEKPATGESVLWQSQYATIDLTGDRDDNLTKVSLQCFHGSFVSSPLKFRFIELYRVMEARYIREVKLTLLANFEAEPKASLEAALKTFKSELNQLIALADISRSYFEMIWTAISDLSAINTLAAALMRKLSLNPGTSSPQWKAGAALVYYLRCAIVHAGEKDMIFESFADGDDLLALIIEHVEEASLSLAGVHLV